MTEVLAFAQKPRRGPSKRGRVIFLDHTIHEVVVQDKAGERWTAAVDPRDICDAMSGLVNALDPVAWLECETVIGVVTHFFLMVDPDGIETVLNLGNWAVEEDVVILCKTVWRDARVPLQSRCDVVEHDDDPGGLLWNTDLPLFAHQSESVRWMRHMERRFPLELHYDGNLKITDRWYVDTENECFTQDPSVRTATLMGGICADGMGRGKTATALRLVAEDQWTPSGVAYESRATLILLPLNLVGQWKRELDKFLHTESMRIFVIVQGRDLPTMQEVLDAHVVLTTFQFVKANRAYSEMVERCLRNRPRERASLSAWTRVADHTECILEAVTWRRIVIDEMHQTFERMADMKHVRLFRTRALWGLTATPTLDNDQAQHLYALLTREKTHHPNLLGQLIARCVRVETSMSSGLAAPKRSLCMVSLSAEERILLGDFEQDSLADKVRKITFVDVGDTTDVTVESQITASRRRECDAARAKVSGHERSVRILERVSAELLDECERAGREAPGSERERISQAAYDAHREDVQVARDMLARQLVRLRQKETIVDTIQQRVGQIQHHAECNLCKRTDGRMQLLPACLHILCGDCLGMNPCCVVCGELIRDAVPVEAARGVGTKMREIVSLLQSIGDTEPSILFVQWKAMMKGTRSFLRSNGVIVHSLDGNASQRTHTLESLTRGGTLLLCLEDGFAGLHLPHVSHVIFAHAIVGDRDRVLTLESQAIARCARYGQTRDVSTYSFVVADTDEEVLYGRTHSLL